MTVTESQVPPALAGATEVDSSILFPEGLVGCPTWTHFVLLTDEDQALPVAMLASLSEPGISLMVTDPQLVVPGYSVALSEADRQLLDLADDQDPVLYCALTTTATGEINANLLGPLVINARTRRGKQVVLSDSPYSARHPVGSVES